MYVKSFWRPKHQFESVVRRNNQFYPQEDNFIIESGIQHITFLFQKTFLHVAFML